MDVLGKSAELVTQCIFNTVLIAHIPHFRRCNGVIGTCPPTAINPIYLQEGQARITVSNFAKTVTYQSSTDKLHLQLSGFSVTCGSLTVRWSLIKAENSCNLGRNNATLSSNTNNHILAGLNLQNTDTYKVVVQASNIREQFGLPVCSNEVTIDTGINDGRLPIIWYRYHP
jgi:hypothetical protein